MGSDFLMEPIIYDKSKYTDKLILIVLWFLNAFKIIKSDTSSIEYGFVQSVAHNLNVVAQLHLPFLLARICF